MIIADIEELFTTKSDNVLRLNYDPIALICYWKKTNLLETLWGLEGQESEQMYWHARLLDKSINKTGISYIQKDEKYIYTPDKESIDEANKIRDYYKLKMYYRSFMTEKKLSPYYIKLKHFFDMPVGTFTSDMIGMIISLPNMYKEDIEYDLLEQNYNSYTPQSIETGTVMSYDLTYVKKIGLSRGKTKYMMYWFTNENNELMVIPVELGNNLIPFIDKLVKNKLTISGRHKTIPLYPNSEFLVGRIYDYELY